MSLLLQDPVIQAPAQIDNSKMLEMCQKNSMKKGNVINTVEEKSIWHF